MLRILSLVLFLLVACFADEMRELKWEKGETFLDFLEKHQIPLKIYYDLQKEDQELAAEIMSGVKFQALFDEKEKIRQVLIPVGDELQIHLDKNASGDFVFNTIPIIYEQESGKISLNVERSPYQDIKKYLNNSILANEFVNAFKGSVDFTQLRKDDKFVIYYEQKRRLGKIIPGTQITAAFLKTKKKTYPVYAFNEGRYYDEKGKELENFFLIRPIDNARISSKFTYKRWHPILKRYRAHLGIDYAAPKGTPIKAAGDGRVSFVGKKGGYGKTVTINHSDGYKTLYAHLSKYNKRAKKGKKVKKGQIIAYVGNTGMSTGPHLHFGLYKNNRAINPAKVVKITKSVLKGKEKKEFLKILKHYDAKFEQDVKENYLPKKEEDFENKMSLKDEKVANV